MDSNLAFDHCQFCKIASYHKLYRIHTLNYQISNKKTVLQTLKLLQDKKLLSISETNIKNGFLNVIKNTHLQGRWQQIGESPKVIIFNKEFAILT